MKIKLLLVLFLLSIVVLGCNVQEKKVSYVPLLEDVFSDDLTNRTEIKEPMTEEITDEDLVQNLQDIEIAYEVKYKEGDLINLSGLVSDPDNDIISFDYSEPFNKNGVWQSKIGDEGSYNVKIEANDGEFTVVEYVKVVLLPVNKAPIVEINDTIRIKEGETLSLNYTVYDLENESVVIKQEGFVTSKNKKITYDDAYPNGCNEKGCNAEYKTFILASDPYQTTKKEITIIVEDVNRKPEITVNDFEFTEGDLVELNYETKDSDDDELKVIISSDLEKVQDWKTKKGDAGKYNLTFEVTDGFDTVEKNVTLTIKELNSLPVIDIDSKIVVEELETIKLDPIITDEDGDNVIVSYEGFMNSSIKKTTLNDVSCENSGCNKTFKTYIVANDGKDIVKKEIDIVIIDKISTITLTELNFPKEIKSVDNIEFSLKYEDVLSKNAKLIINWFVNDKKVKEDVKEIVADEVVDIVFSNENYKKDDVVRIEISAKNNNFEKSLVKELVVKNSPPRFVFN